MSNFYPYEQRLSLSQGKAVCDVTFGYCGIKDKDSTYLKVNKEMTTLFNGKFRYPQEFIGLNEFEVFGSLANEDHISRYLEHDKIALGGTYWSGFEPANWGNRYGDLIAITIKYPLFDEDGQVSSIFLQCIPLQWEKIDEMFAILAQSHKKYQQLPKQKSVLYEFYNVHTAVSLSVREQEVLFYTIRGKSAKEIAKILVLSFRTIETYLEAIKIKMNCRTKNQLIAKAINDGHLNKIPLTLVDKGLIVS